MLRRSQPRQVSKGFTLIECVVVIVLMAILLAFVFPQFEGQKAEASDTEAEATLQSALVAASIIYTKTRALPSDPSTLTNEDPDTNFISATSTSTNSTEASVGTNSAGTIFASAVMGGENTCWMTSRSLDDSSSSVTPTLYAIETNSSPGFYCSAAFALGINSCPSTTGHTGADFSSVLFCRLNTPTSVESVMNTAP